jgi:hypothetical protein
MALHAPASPVDGNTSKRTSEYSRYQVARSARGGIIHDDDLAPATPAAAVTQARRQQMRAVPIRDDDRDFRLQFDFTLIESR